MVPVSSIEMPRASPLRTSARELTDQTIGSTAAAAAERQTNIIGKSKYFFI